MIRLLFFLFFNLILSSDYNIYGEILNSDNSPISDVNIFLDELDIGTTTNNNGYFLLSIKNYQFDKINLHFQIIGYKKESKLILLDSSNINLGKFFLESENIKLKTIQIHSHRQEAGQISDIIISKSSLNENLKGNIANTLSKLPNIGVNSYGITTSKPSLRGFSGDRFLLTKEGNEIGDLSQSSIDHAIALDMTEVESLEIIRGPKALIFGPNAIGGVVNTNLYGSPRVRVKRLMFKYLIGLESVNSSSYGNLIVYLPILKNQLNIFVSNKATGNQLTPTGELENTNSNVQNFKASLTNYQNNGYLNINFEEFNMKYGIPPNPGGHITGVDIKLYKKLSQISYHRDISLINFNTFDIQYNFIDYEHQELVNEQDEFHVSLAKKTHDLSFKLGSDQKKIGFEINLKEFLPKGFYFTPKTKETEISLYRFEETNVEKFDIDLLTSFRYSLLKIRPNLVNVQFNNLESIDIKDRNFNNVSVSFGVKKLISKIELNSWFMYTMRSPRVEELYSDGPHLGTYAYEIGNPILDIERIYGFESALSYNSEKLNYSIITFYNYSPFYFEMTKMGNCEKEWIPGYSHPCAGADFIDWGSGEFGFLYKYNSKGNKAIIKGLELQLGRKLNNLITNYEFSFVIGDNLTKNIPLSYINPMKQILDFKYSLGIFNYKIRFSKIHPQNRLGEFETPTPGVLLTDLIFELKYQNHNLVIQSNNIFDKIHYNHLSRIKSITPEPGRNFHLIYNLRI